MAGGGRSMSLKIEASISMLMTHIYMVYLMVMMEHVPQILLCSASLQNSFLANWQVYD